MIKIDVEGHEREAIRGGEVTFGQSIPTLVIEVLSETRRREVAALLQGYELRMLDKTNMLGTPIVQRAP